MPIDRDELLAHLEAMRESMVSGQSAILREVELTRDGITSRLDTLNGKTASHAERLATLEERSKADWPARVASAVAVLGAGLSAFLGGDK